MKLGWNRLKKALQRFFPSGSWLWFPFQRLLSVLRRQLRSNESPVERRPEKNVERVTPPNLQLNLSSNHFSDSPIRKSHELFMAAVAAIILQSGLIAIALITVYHEPTRDSLGSAPSLGVFLAMLLARYFSRSASEFIPAVSSAARLKRFTGSLVAGQLHAKN